METENTSITSINKEKFSCLNCDFKCYKKGDWERHLNTTKHKKKYNVTTSDEELHKNTSHHICSICLKKYNSRNGLWLHKKKCISSEVLVEPSINQDASNNIMQLLINENKDFKNMIMELVKSNTELQKQMVDVCKQIQPGTINNMNSHNNNNNKTFNLQLFLNEECKDAMNMSEFINSIQLKLSDLENMGKLGYTEGMSNILINQLNGTDTFKRPVHCSDAKRETLYIKEENKWEKEGPDNKKMKNAIRHIEQKNFKMLNEWQAKHPHFKESSSNDNDTYLQIVSKSTNGTPENMNKVIKKMLKNIIIEK